MSAWDSLFWMWFALASIIMVYAMIYEYSLMTLFFGMNMIGFGLLKLSQEKKKTVKVSRKLLEKLKSI